jgi:hypothetical protein
MYQRIIPNIGLEKLSGYFIYNANRNKYTFFISTLNTTLLAIDFYTFSSTSIKVNLLDKMTIFEYIDFI